MQQHRRPPPGGSYRAHEALVRPARVQPQLWRLLLGMALVTLVSLTATVGLQMLLVAVAPGAWLAELSQGSSPGAMLVMLGSFGFLALGVALAARLLHRRGLISVVGALPPLVWQFSRVSLYLLGLSLLLLLLPPYDMGAPMEPNLRFGHWLALLPLSLLAVLVQVSAEEIVFRGYVQQQLAARFNSPLVWMVLPSALFAAGHYLPAEAGENALMVALWAGVFGILMADLTARSGSLGPAIAVHLWNNVSAILIVSLPDDLSGLALYLTPFSMDDAAALRSWLPVDFALMLVSWLAARLAIRR